MARTPHETPAQKRKVQKVMDEFKSGKLRSGSKTGPKVKSRKQAVAIALSEAGASRPPPGKAKTQTGRRTTRHATHHAYSM